MKKKFAIGTGIMFVFCLLGVAIANGVLEADHDYLKRIAESEADYELERITECEDAVNNVKNTTDLRVWTYYINKLGEEKLLSCIGALVEFNLCADTTMADIDNPSDKVVCACVAFENYYFNKLKGRIVYDAILAANGIIVRDRVEVRKDVTAVVDEELRYKKNRANVYKKCSSEFKRK